MPFSRKLKTDVLVNSRRCCCVCHEFAGVYTDVHHIIQEADGGPNTIDNAIALCLRCHGEAGHYNDRHAIGNKYKPDELVQHRDEWWSWCSTNPHKPLPCDPITCSPESLSLGSPTYKDHFEINLYNRITLPLYEVLLRIRTATGPLKPSKHLKVARNLAPQDLILSGDDETGTDNIYVFVSTINPNESTSLGIEVPQSGQLQSKSEVLFELMNVETTLQITRKTTDDSTMLPFSFPFHASIKGVLR